MSAKVAAVDGGGRPFRENNAPRERVPTAEELTYMSRFGHMNEEDEGESELSRMARSSSVADPITMKMFRDELRSAVQAAIDAPSVYSLVWASRIIQLHTGGHLTPGRFKEGRRSLKNISRLSLLAMVTQVAVPLCLLAEGRRNSTLPNAICPAFFDPSHGRSIEEIDTVFIRISVYLMCIVSLLTNYGSIQQEENAYRFFATFANQDLRRQKAAGDSTAPQEDSRLSDAAFCGFPMLASIHVQRASFKLVLCCLAYLFYTQNTIADIVLNALALVFILEIDNTITSPITARVMVQRELRHWFDNFDWYGPKASNYIEHELSTPNIQVLGIRIKVPRLLLFGRLLPETKTGDSVNWFEKHALLNLLELADFFVLPTLAIYFVLGVGTCISPSFGDDD